MWAKPKQRAASIQSIPAPTKGLNDYESIANMDPTFALDMLNMFPSAKSLKVRNGYQVWTTGLLTAVRTLASYNSSSGANELWAFNDSGIFDVTTSGAAPSASIAITNGYMSTLMFANIAGQYLIAVNGTDMGKIYDGSSWANMVTTGASTQDMIAVHAYNKKIWFVEQNSMVAWYLPTDAVTGVLTPFYLGGVFTRGGFLQNIFTWSLDSGEGLDDVLVFQSSTGEICGYIGPDPNTAATFELKATYFVGAPLGQRTSDDLGGDVAMLNVGGVTPISKVIGGTQAISRDEDTLTKNISQTFNNILSAIGLNPGWEIRNFPSLTALFVNFPATGGRGALQFVMNTLTGAWTRYNLPIKTMAEHNETLYFSDENGLIYISEPSNNLDNLSVDGSAGLYIVSGFQTAYNYFGMPGMNKIYSLIRPNFISQYSPSMNYNVSVDFAPNPVDAISDTGVGPSPSDSWDTALWDVNMWFLPNAPTQADVWDSGVWDETLWSPPFTAQLDWLGVGQMGYSSSLAVKVSTFAPTEFVSCDWALTPGQSL